LEMIGRRGGQASWLLGEKKKRGGKKESVFHAWGRETPVAGPTQDEGKDDGLPLRPKGGGNVPRGGGGECSFQGVRPDFFPWLRTRKKKKWAC